MHIDWAVSLLSDVWCLHAGSLITAEAAELLECVLETIQHLWNYLETTEQKRENKELVSTCTVFSTIITVRFNQA